MCFFCLKQVGVVAYTAIKNRAPTILACSTWYTGFCGLDLVLSIALLIYFTSIDDSRIDRKVCGEYGGSAGDGFLVFTLISSIAITCCSCCFVGKERVVLQNRIREAEELEI